MSSASRSRPTHGRSESTSAEALADAVRRVREHEYPIDHASDHGATVSVYLTDPDGNGVELSYDRPRERWFDDAGRPVLKVDPLMIEEILTGRG